MFEERSLKLRPSFPVPVNEREKESERTVSKSQRKRERGKRGARSVVEVFDVTSVVGLVDNMTTDKIATGKEKGDATAG